MKKISLSLLVLLLCAFVVAAQKVPVQEFILDNGMKVLLVPRKGDPNVAAGWVAQRRLGQRAPRHHRPLAPIRAHDV